MRKPWSLYLESVIFSAWAHPVLTQSCTPGWTLSLGRTHRGNKTINKKSWKYVVGWDWFAKALASTPTAFTRSSRRALKWVLLHTEWLKAPTHKKVVYLEIYFVTVFCKRNRYCKINLLSCYWLGYCIPSIGCTNIIFNTSSFKLSLKLI